MRLTSPPPDQLDPCNTERATKPCGAGVILQEIIRKHFDGFTACPLTSPHRFSPLTVLGKYARVWHRPDLNRANNLNYILGNLSDHIVYAEDGLKIKKSIPTRLFIRFHDEWTDLKFVRDFPDHYDFKRSKVYHAAVDFGDVIIKSIEIPHLKELLKTARFSIEQLVPGQVYHLVHSVVLSTRLRFLGDLQSAYLSEIPDDVFVTQYTQFNSLRDVVCRGVGACQTECPIAFKTCDIVLDSKGRLTLLENWNETPPPSPGTPEICNPDLTSSLDPSRIVLTDSVIGSSYLPACLFGLYHVLKVSLSDKAAIPRAMRLLKLISAVSQTVTFPRPKFVCRSYEIGMLRKCGYDVRSCNQLADVAVRPRDGDSSDRSKQFARVLAWAALLPTQIFSNLVKELSLEEVPKQVEEKRKTKKKVRISSSLLMSEV